MRTWVKVGESMRSEVSSRRRRSEGFAVGEADVDVGGGCRTCAAAAAPIGSLMRVSVGEGGASMPDSARTKSSWSRGGSR